MYQGEVNTKCQTIHGTNGPPEYFCLLWFSQSKDFTKFYVLF